MTIKELKDWAAGYPDEAMVSVEQIPQFNLKAVLPAAPAEVPPEPASEAPEQTPSEPVAEVPPAAPEVA